MNSVDSPQTLSGLLQSRRINAYRHGALRVLLAWGGLWLLIVAGMAAYDSKQEPVWNSAPVIAGILWIGFLGMFWRAHCKGCKDAALALQRLEEARPELGQLFSTAAWTLDNPAAGGFAPELRAQAVAALERTPGAGGVDPQGRRAPFVLGLAGAVALVGFVVFSDLPGKTLGRVLFSSGARYSELAFGGMPAELLPKDGVSGKLIITGRARGVVRLRTRINGGAVDERVLTVRDGQAAVIMDPPSGEVSLEAFAGDAVPVRLMIPFVAPPKLVRPQVVVTAPAYTLQKEQVIKDRNEVEVLEGSTLIYSAGIDPAIVQAKSVATGRVSGGLAAEGDARWQGGDVALKATAQAIKAGPEPAPNAETPAERKTSKGDMTLQVRSERALESNMVTLSVVVVADAMPEATIDGEETDTGVVLKGALTDDVGLGKTGMFMVVQGKEVELKTQSLEGKSKGVTLVAEVTRENLGVTDEETVKVYSWAEDLAPQHAGKRTVSEPLEIVVPKKDGEPPKPQKPSKPKEEKKPKKLELKKDLERMAAEIKRLAEEEDKLSKAAAEPGSDAKASAAQQQQAENRLQKVREKMAELLPANHELEEAAAAADAAIKESAKALEANNTGKGAKKAAEAAEILKELGKGLGAQSGSPEEQAEAAAQQAKEAAEALEATPSADKAKAASRAAAGLGRATGSPKAGDLSKQLAEAGQPKNDTAGEPSEAQKESEKQSEAQRKELAAELKEEARKTLAKAAEEKLKQEAATMRANELAREMMKEATSPFRNPNAQPPGQKPGDGQKPGPQPGENSPPSDQESKGQGSQKGKGEALAKELGKSGSEGLMEEGARLEQGFERGKIPDYMQLNRILRMTDQRLKELAAERKRRLNGKEAAGSGADLTRKYLQELSDDATPGAEQDRTPKRPGGLR